MTPFLLLLAESAYEAPRALTPLDRLSGNENLRGCLDCLVVGHESHHGVQKENQRVSSTRRAWCQPVVSCPAQLRPPFDTALSIRNLTPVVCGASRNIGQPPLGCCLWGSLSQ
jgi:hypothetical protein